ncbi:MAG: type I secretion system permease/ATPase [Magnetococcales bacterium]|nr:type I secretion system permease/ATPase [Magnetococcales bacterium]
MIFSGGINVLTLTGALFMLEVYDRVLPSRSIPTLTGLFLLVLLLMAAHALLESVRGRMLNRMGAVLDEELNRLAFEATARIPLLIGASKGGSQPLRDLDSVRGFMAGAGPAAWMDLPWTPFYLAIIFLLHPALGWTALAGAVVLAILTIVADFKSRQPMAAASRQDEARDQVVAALLAHSDTAASMNLTPSLYQRWRALGLESNSQHARAADIAVGFAALSKVFRLFLQSALLGVGALLVIEQQATAGVMIAASIIGGRALAPVDGALAHWKSFVAARQAWNRLSGFLTLLPTLPAPLPLPAPVTGLEVEGLAVAPPGEKKPVVKELSFTLYAGQGLGVAGASASGKSSLLRALVGAWTPLQGKIRLDGADLSQWSREDLGHHVGWMAQETALFSGTVAENIARFALNPDPDTVVKAAKAAAAHDLIVRLPQGYDTPIGPAGMALSGGQRQRIGLARALYGEPFLVVLDEPNAHLDPEGEQALMQAIQGIKARGGMVIVSAHRSSVLSGMDLVLMMNQGSGQLFTPARQTPVPQETKRTGNITLLSRPAAVGQ